MTMTTAPRTGSIEPERTTGGRARTGIVVVAGVVSGLLLAGALVSLLATQVFGFQVIQVSSGSMGPVLRPGDLFVTRPVDIADVQIGDVVLFEQGRDTPILVAHRVHGIVNLRTTIHDAATGERTTQVSKMLQTKGDANPTPDAELVDADRLRGILWFRLPGAGRLFGSLDPRHGLILAALSIAVAWGIYEVVRAAHAARRRAGPDGQP